MKRIRITLDLDVESCDEQGWHNWVSNLMSCPSVAGCGCTFAYALTSWPERPTMYDAEVQVLS